MSTGKTGQAQELENHLTELLDGPAGGPYSQSTLQGRATLQGARQKMATDGPETWLGRRVTVSGPSPLRAANIDRKGPGCRSRGLSTFWRLTLSRAKRSPRQSHHDL